MADIKDIGEFGLIERISRMLPTSSAVINGIGDDCAVVRFFDHIMIVSCDLFIDGVHFDKGYSSYRDIGWKAAAASMSDIAAMGGQPMFALVALSCPADLDVADIQNLYQGMSSALSRFGAVIIGGDTTNSNAGISIDVTVIGQTIAGQYLTRRGARPGDALAITGPLGLSSGGLHACINANDAESLRQAHLRPRPRIPEGQWLASQPFTHAMIDISDGLAQDAGHVAERSTLGVNIKSSLLKSRPDLESYCEDQSLNPLELMLNGGEDYELAFAIDGKCVDKAIGNFAKEFRSDITVVGEFTCDFDGVRVDGEEISSKGFDHFRQD